ncbi:MAG: hypothetical protein CL489_06715 [Acidobacteria bacterium]|nr:hypothetical protein [Acidobacteriota bacterium]
MPEDASGVGRNKTGQFVKNEEYPQGAHQKERRNPTTYAGTSKDAIKMRKTVPWTYWIPGTWKFLQVFAKSGKAEEQEIYGIEDEILTDPDILLVQAADLPEDAVEMVQSICEEHGAPWLRMCSSQEHPKTKHHGFRRLEKVMQDYTGRLGLKVVIVIMIESVCDILKPSQEEYGRLLKSMIRRITILSNKIARMEKTAGQKYVNGYLSRSKKGARAYAIMEQERITKITKGERAGDSKVAFDLEVSQ